MSKIGSDYLKTGGEHTSAHTQMLKVYDEYKALLHDKTHPDNQTPAYHKNVQGVMNRLLSAALELDREEAGKGLFALFTLLIRSNLLLKDKLVEMEVETNRLKKQVKKKNG